MTTNFRQPKYKTNGNGYVAQIPNKINYCHGLGHLALLGLCGWAMHAIHFDQSPPPSPSFCCFLLLIGHNLLGVFRFTHPTVSECVVKIYHITTILAQTLPLLLVTTQICINFQFQFLLNYIYVQIVFGLLPTLCDLSNQTRYRDHTLHAVVLGNALILAYIGIYKEKFWSTGLAALSVLNHFSLKLITNRYDVPITDLCIVGLGFFTVFAVNCLNE